MSDALLSNQDREEALSCAYVSAVAAGAGYTTARQNYDRDSVDITFAAGGLMRPRIDAQLKASINLTPVGDVYKIVLKKKNYDELRGPTQTPRILVALALPKDENQWLNISLDELIIRKCAVWASLKGMPDIESQASITISIPVANRFDVEGLRQLMDKARSGAIT
jgi:hypothetical protein